MMREIVKESDKLRELDEKLTAIAKRVHLSIDSTKKRVEKLERDGVIGKYTIQPVPSRIGLPLAVHVYIKLRNVTKERHGEFISEMTKNPRVIDVMSMLGDYDMYIVILAKNTAELDKMKIETKEKFADMIGDWKEVLVTEVHKLEEYSF